MFLRSSLTTDNYNSIYSLKKKFVTYLRALVTFIRKSQHKFAKFDPGIEKNVLRIEGNYLFFLM